MNNISISFKLFDAASEWLNNERQDMIQATQTPNRKPSFLKLCPVIIDTLKKVYSVQNITGEGNSTPYL